MKALYTKIENNIYESISKEVYDNLIETFVLLPTDGKLLEGIVISRKRTSDGIQLIGRANANFL